MRAGLRWALGATLVLSVAAVWWPTAAPPRWVAAVERPAGAPPAGAMAGALAAADGPLPAQLPDMPVEPARRDIFAPVPVAAAPAAQPKFLPPPPSAVAVLPPPAPLPAPAAPPPAVRYLGSMTTPAGERIVMLARGDVALPVQVGTDVGDGYVVQSISANTVRLAWAAGNIAVDVPIPETEPASR